MLKKVKIKNIRPNPFRNIERYPIRKEKVEALIKSYKETGIWPVILGRETGQYVEIPFGHHRKEAWERTMKPTEEIEINILSLSDTDMIKMMAHENLEEWGTSAIVEIETVSAVVRAYAEGKIELNGLSKDTKNVYIRYAPSFIPDRRVEEGTTRPYTVDSVGKFLGWVTSDGHAQKKVSMALTALQLIEEGIMSEDDFLGLKTTESEELVRETKARKDERESEAQEMDKKALEAKVRYEAATTYQSKKLAEEQEQYALDRAQKTRELGKKEAAKVGKHLSKGMREGDIAAKGARMEANKIVGLQKQERELRQLNTFARQITGDLDKILDDDKYKEKLNALVRSAADIDYGVRDFLIGSLEGLADRALEFARKFKPVEVKKAVTPITQLLKNE